MDAYSQELYKSLGSNNTHVSISKRTPSSSDLREVTPPPRPITPSPPDVSDERLEHTRKLQTIKDFISSDEADYYRRVRHVNWLCLRLLRCLLYMYSQEKTEGAMVSYTCTVK